MSRARPSVCTAMSQIGSSTSRPRASASSCGPVDHRRLVRIEGVEQRAAKKRLVRLAAETNRPLREGLPAGIIHRGGGIHVVDPVLGGVVPRPQEVEEFHPFAQAALHHFRALDHFRHDGCDLGGAKIEFLIEILDRLEDLGVAQVRIVERRDLRALLGQKIDLLVIEPAVFLCLPVQECPRIRRRQRNLNRMRIDLLGEIQRLLDRLLGLARADRE